MSHSLDSELYDDWRHQACRAEAAAFRARVAELEATLAAVAAVIGKWEAERWGGGILPDLHAAIGDPSPYLAEYRSAAWNEGVAAQAGVCGHDSRRDRIHDPYARADEPVGERRTRDTEPANPRQPDAEAAHNPLRDAIHRSEQKRAERERMDAEAALNEEPIPPIETSPFWGGR